MKQDFRQSALELISTLGELYDRATADPRTFYAHVNHAIDRLPRRLHRQCLQGAAFILIDVAHETGLPDLATRIREKVEMLPICDHPEEQRFVTYTAVEDECHWCRVCGAFRMHGEDWMAPVLG